MINISIGRISHRFRDMASFRCKTHIFPTFFYSTPNLARNLS